MDKILKQNLNIRFFERMLEPIIDIHFGVADKFLLISQLRNNTYRDFDHLYQEAYVVLSQFGYGSKALKKAIEERKRIAEDNSAYADWLIARGEKVPF